MRVLSELSGVAVFHMVASFEQIQDRGKSQCMRILEFLLMLCLLKSCCPKKSQVHIQRQWKNQLFKNEDKELNYGDSLAMVKEEGVGEPAE